MKKTFLTLTSLAIMFLTACGGPAAPGKYAEVAKCLTSKSVVMYGAYWCPHCANQKKAFGDDFQFVKYQECDPKGAGGDKKACLEAGVTSYPTWGFPGQGNLVGEQTVADLAKLANCTDKLPQEDQDKLKAAQAEADKQDAEAAKESTNADSSTTSAK